MNIKSLAAQDNSQTIDGMLLGGILAFWSSLIYAIAIIVFVTISFGPSNGEELVLPILSLAIFIFILGIIPATLMGAMGGAAIGFILSLWKKRLPDISASIIALSVGMVIVSTINYAIWYFLVSGTDSFYNTLKLFLFHGFGYVLPNIIAIIFSPYVGWRINAIKISNVVSE